ncbi:MAG TPA: lipid-A-disaccharide synthase [Bacteroidales bacterium]|nr:lipid-A-disaccharide synthase [Bacteroidales bacterium]
MKYYIIAGEASGDLHAANLMKEIKLQDPEADFRCWGGDLMEQQGGDIVKHYKDLAFMGFWEVATNLNTILRNMKICKIDILLYEPDVVVLVDYPGFNLRIAEFAKENHFRVVYYISPQIWAWKTGRIHKIKKVVDRMMTILPFEKAFYAKYDYEADYVGHPLLDAVSNDIKQREEVINFRSINHLDDRPIIALLPGSRKQEIVKILPVMLQMIDQYPDYQFVVSVVPWLPIALYDDFLKEKNVSTVVSQTYPLVLNAELALVTSGTATLETAILGTPQVVCYSTSALSYRIAKSLVMNVKYISLVNLVLDKMAVTELIQQDLNRNKLKVEMDKLLFDEAAKRQLSEDYQLLLEKLGNEGASKRAAAIVVKTLNS